MNEWLWMVRVRDVVSMEVSSHVHDDLMVS